MKRVVSKRKEAGTLIQGRGIRDCIISGDSLSEADIALIWAFSLMNL